MIYEKCEDGSFQGLLFGRSDWIVTAGGRVLDKTFVPDNTFDCSNRAIGNCFKTKESAEMHKEEMMKIMKGENDE